MVQAMLKLWNTAAEYISWHDQTPPVRPPQAPRGDTLHQVGDYYADYSEIPAAELAKPADADVAALFNGSTVISVKQ